MLLRTIDMPDIFIIYLTFFIEKDYSKRHTLSVVDRKCRWRKALYYSAARPG